MVLLIKSDCGNCKEIDEMSKDYPELSKLYVKDGKVQLEDSEIDLDPRIPALPALLSGSIVYVGKKHIKKFLNTLNNKEEEE